MNLLFLLIAQVLCLNSLHAKLVVSDNPSTIITGDAAQLQRPEGLSFSPSGDCLAVANSSGNSVTIYSRTGSEGTLYDSVPTCVIKNGNLLAYPHDLDFSPCGQYLAVANRNKHCISFFKRSSTDNCYFESKTYNQLKGKRTRLQLPASVAYSPTGDFLAVANRQGGGPITFYLPNLKKGKPQSFELVPFDEIQSKELQALNISGSHGIAVSNDGSMVAAVHKRYSQDSLGNSSLVIYKNQAAPSKSPKFAPVFIKDFGVNCLHSISFHPSGKYLTISHERENVMIFQRVGETSEFELLTSIPIDKQGNTEGAKGVVFSPQGNCIAITTMIPEVLIYDIYETDDLLKIDDNHTLKL